VDYLQDLPCLLSLILGHVSLGRFLSPAQRQDHVVWIRFDIAFPVTPSTCATPTPTLALEKVQKEGQRIAALQELSWQGGWGQLVPRHFQVISLCQVTRPGWHGPLYEIETNELNTILARVTTPQLAQKLVF
jgi:hypothetical protein